MSERRARIVTTNNLPPRARVLAPEDVSKIFGGCGGYLAQCYNDSDCCLLAFGSGGGCHWDRDFGTKTGRCWPD